jgi:hypothetical protein
LCATVSWKLLYLGNYSGCVCNGGLVEFSAQRQKHMLQPYHGGERLLQVF